MGNIQSGINQFFSKAAILSRLAPGFEERQENYKLAKEEKLLSKEYDQTLQGAKESGLGEEEFERAKKTHERIINLRERQFQNKPTKENYKKLLDFEKAHKESVELYEMYKSIQRGKAQLQQKMSFDKFKKQLTVKDLPQNLQERAYNEYTSKE